MPEVMATAEIQQIQRITARLEAWLDRPGKMVLLQRDQGAVSVTLLDPMSRRTVTAKTVAHALAEAATIASFD